MAKALQTGKSIQVIGDNVDYAKALRHENKDNHKHMEHKFASTVLI